MRSPHTRRAIAESAAAGGVPHRIRSALAAAAAELEAGGARREALAEYVAPHKVLVIPRPAALRPLGHVWPLGVLLLAADPPEPGRERALYATGTTTRAVPPGHSQHVALSMEVRRGYRAAAFRGPFQPGETVNFGATAIDPDALAEPGDACGPLFVGPDRTVLVRWAPGGPDSAARALPGYLTEHVGLLLGR